MVHLRLAVSDGALEFAQDGIGIVLQRDKRVLVFVRLGHLFGGVLQRADPRTGFHDIRFRHSEHRAIQTVEPLRNIAGQLTMLLLVRAHRHIVRLVQQNVRRHQRRIGKQTEIDVVGVFL